MVGVAVGPGVEVGPVVGTGVGSGPPPQTSPFTVKVVGTATLPLCVPWKPKEAVPPLAPMVPFQWLALFDAVTVCPELLKFAFQPLPNCSFPANVQTRLQP